MLLVTSFAGCAPSGTPTEFDFRTVRDLDQMRTFLANNFPLETDRSALRALFVDDSGAALHTHPERSNVEKYVYDINICELYVWRWNISADYAEDGGLEQIYLNGDPIHRNGNQPPKLEDRSRSGGNEGIFEASRPRPEARKGESELTYILYDVDLSSSSIDDQFAVGAGPSRADPENFGQVKVYNVERWRSIFDAEPARAIVTYPGPCP